ncbi:RNA polymerase sigma factor [bacterium]|nr:RNA polymerase sigma factor [bacterium]
MRKKEESYTHQPLVEPAMAGDSIAQHKLYDAYAKAMFNTCFRILNNRQDAEDALQEAFVKAFSSLSHYRKEASFGAWLKRIVVNHAINTLKKRKMKWVDLDLQAWENVLEEDTENIITEGFSADDAYSTLYDLPDGYRTVFSLYLLEGYDHKEISEILGISVSTSISQYNRAKKKLKALLMQKKDDHGTDRKILRESA